MPDVPLIGQSREPEPPKVVEARTAFLVFINKEGAVALSPDIDIPLTVERQPHPDEMYGALTTAIKNVAAQEAAVYTMNFIANSARQAQEAQMNAQIQQALAAKNVEANKRR